MRFRASKHPSIFSESGSKKVRFHLKPERSRDSTVMVQRHCVWQRYMQSCTHHARRARRWWRRSFKAAYSSPRYRGRLKVTAKTCRAMLRSPTKTPLRPEPLRAVCFVGFPPPELLNYQSSISIMEGPSIPPERLMRASPPPVTGLIAHMTYHDEGLTRSQVYNAYFRWGIS